MKLKEVLSINSALRSLIDGSDIQLDAKLKFKILTILKQLESHVANFEILRNEKIQECGTKDDEGNYTIFKDDTENIRKFADAMNDLAESDVDVAISKIKASEIMQYAIPSEVLVGVYDIIEED